jgi:hypothetical protein
MNKTAVFITFAALAGLGIAGAVVLLIHRPDASATFTSLLVLILGLVVTAAGTFYGFGKQGEKLDEIQKQTNGNLTSRDKLIAEQAALIAELNRQLPPKSAESPQTYRE